MKLRNIKTIISREYLTRVQKKSFLLITFLGPVFFAAIALLPSIIMFMAEDKGKQIAVVDQSGIVLPKMESDATITYHDYSTANPDSLKTQLSDLEMDAMVLVSPLDSATNSVNVSAFSNSPISVDLKERISDKIDEAVEDYRISLYDVGDLKQIMNEVKSDVNISTYTIGEDGEEKISSSEVFMIISLLLSTIIYFFIAMFSGMVMQSVIEEKTSRVVEVLVSSVKATELMFGKIIGVACVALTQFLLWIVLTAVLVTGVSAFVGFDTMMGDPAQSEQMMQMTGQMSGVDMEQMAAVTEGDGLGVIISTLKEINYGQLIFGFFIYFALGYLLYASFFAAIGSAVENEADTQQLQMPITVPLIIGFFIAFYAFKAPDSAVVFWGSMIPFTSPIVMLARIPFGVPAWELALSIAILVGTFIACGWASAKIYQIGILMFGKKTTFKDLWKWLRMK
ncbi:MAG: ABC transporter permease [Bacteroidales bacterium]|nr:ABC transporter permease [Bacteroidales bacterium]